MKQNQETFEQLMSQQLEDLRKLIKEVHTSELQDKIIRLCDNSSYIRLMYQDKLK